MANNEFIRTPATARMLGISEATLRCWRVQGKGPRFFKVGSLVMYKPDDVHAFIDQCAASSTSEVTERMASA